MKHAVITGGSSGIGRAIALKLWKRGYHLTLMARRSPLLEETKRSFKNEPHNPAQTILTIPVDVSQSAEVEHACAQSLQQFKQVDILITSAGIAVPGDFLDQPLQISEETMAINFFGSLYSSRMLLPAMVKRGKGHVLFISSGVGLIGLYGYSSYSPSKFAIRGLAESLRAEMKPHGVHVSIVYPPDTDTPQLQRERDIKPLVTQKISETSKILSPEQVAQAMIQGLDKHHFLITPGLEMTALGRLHSLLLPVLNRYFDHIAAQVLNRRNRL